MSQCTVTAGLGGPPRPGPSPSHSLWSLGALAQRKHSVTVSRASASNTSAAWASGGQEATSGLFNNSEKSFSVLERLVNKLRRSH